MVLWFSHVVQTLCLVVRVCELECLNSQTELEFRDFGGELRQECLGHRASVVLNAPAATDGLFIRYLSVINEHI